MNKKAIIAIIVAAVSAACSSSPAPVANSNATASQRSPMSVPSHGNPPESPTQSEANTGGQKTKWTQSGDPIDTAAFDAAIAKAEKELKASPTNAAKKTALGTAYAARGTALTEARQYASALGDFRRAVKYDPSNAKAKEMMDEIISIYESMNREYPKEGEEPGALKK